LRNCSRPSWSCSAARCRALMISRTCSDWLPIVSLGGKLGARVPVRALRRTSFKPLSL
jgi:hypothetical protein